MSKKIITAIVGFGMSAEYFHAPFINANPNFILKKIVERKTGKSKQVYPHINIVRSYEEILNDPGIELIVITTPNSTHYEMGKQALLAGKHVVIEKPFTRSSIEAGELIDIAEEKEKVLAVYQNRRWDGDFLTVKKIIREKPLGELVEYRSHFDRYRNFIKPSSWKEEGTAGTGLLYDIGPHLIDQALNLFGKPETIFADLRVQREGSKIIDNFELILSYGKLKVILNSGFLYLHPLTRFALFGTEGAFIKNGLDPQEDMLKKEGYTNSPEWGKEPGNLWGVLYSQAGGIEHQRKIKTAAGCYQKFYENIFDAIVNDAPLAVKPEEAYTTIRIIELAIESSNRKSIINFKD